MRTSSGCSLRTGFTLTESLVTIAIIGTLLAITLPVLSGAARTSREIACLANIREAGTTAAAWSLENRDLPPHFETSRHHLDPLGVPQIVIPYEQFTAVQDYFDQTWLWLRAVATRYDAVPRDLTCTGLRRVLSDQGSSNSYISTTYHLSSALLAHPSVFTPDTMGEYAPSMFRPQSLSSCSFPSRKSLLSEQTVAHDGGQLVRTIDRRHPSAPVAFVDGHATIPSFTDAAHIQIPADATSSQAFMHTPLGVLGRDIPQSGEGNP